MRENTKVKSSGQKPEAYLHTFTGIDPMFIPVIDKQAGRGQTYTALRRFKSKGPGNVEHTCLGVKIPSAKPSDNIPLLKPVVIVSRKDGRNVSTVGYCYFIDRQHHDRILFREGWTDNNFMIPLYDIVGVYSLIGVIEN